MKKRMNSHKQLCLRQNCCGAKNDQQNYLSATNRHIHSTSRLKKSDVKKPISKKKVVKNQNKENKQNKQNNNAHSQVYKILQQSYNQIKQENNKLTKKLSSKKKKIQQLQEKIREYEISLQKSNLQVDHFKSLLKAYQQKKYTQENQQKNNKGLKYQNILQAQQSLTKQTLQKYKSLQKEYEKYKQVTQKKLNSYESKIGKLEKQNISMENKLLVQKKYQNEVEGIKKELNRFQQKHTRSVRESSEITIGTLQSENGQLREKIHLLEEQLLCVSSKLKQNQLAFEYREQQLLSNLDKISQKVSKFQQDTKIIQQKSSTQTNEWKSRYQTLLQKYIKKKQKYFNKNQEWAEIFKEFIIEIDRLKKEIAYISERNVKLVELYVEGETKDN